MKKFLLGAAFLCALLSPLAAARAADAAAPPLNAAWGSGSGLVLQPCGDDRFQASVAVVYSLGGSPLHADFHAVFPNAGAGHGWESTETRCLANGITTRVRVWITDFANTVGCKYWADTINYAVTSTITREWCGGI